MPKASKPEASVSTSTAADIDGRGTALTTQTILEDRTDSPEVLPMVEYDVVDHGVVDKHGTVLTTVMEPVGGFPKAEVSE